MSDRPDGILLVFLARSRLPGTVSTEQRVLAQLFYTDTSSVYFVFFHCDFLPDD